MIKEYHENFYDQNSYFHPTIEICKLKASYTSVANIDLDIKIEELSHMKSK